MTVRETFKGTGVAVITPFKNDSAVDLEALGKVLDFIIGNGINYIVTMGTTGETPVLSKEEKKEIIEFTYLHVDDRVPVVVGIGGNDTNALLKDLEYFPLERASAILTAGPYYNKPSQEGIFQHYKKIAESSPKPVILYNVPGRTGRNITTSTTIRLASEIENIVGIKEASGDIQQCMEILRDRPLDFLVVSGDDALALPQLACGMDGVISVAANCLPEQFISMVNACMRNDFKSAKEINDKLMDAYHLLFSENNPAGAKAFLFEIGLIQNIVRLPVVPLSGELHQLVKTYLNVNV